MVNMGGFMIGQGELMVAIAAIATAIATVISQIGLRHISLGLFAMIRTAIGSVIFFVLAVQLFGVAHFTDVFAPLVWQWMLIYGAVIVAGGQLCWFQGLKTTSTAEISLASAFGPIAGILAAYFILGEAPTLAQIMGGTVIMAGVIINQMGVAQQAIANRRSDASVQQAMDLEVGFKGI